MQTSVLGPLLIGVAAVLWGTDAIFRTSTLAVLDAKWVVLVDHLIGLGLLTGWVLYRFGTRIFQLSRGEWMAAVLVGAGGSAAATVLFTESFRYLNPSLPILLQKLQPLWAVLIARLVLGERTTRRFLLWGGVALFCAFIISFPDLDFRDPASYLGEQMGYLKGISYAMASTLLWSVATVGGKALLRRTPCWITVFWRYFFGVAALGVVLALQRQGVPWEVLQSRSVEFSFIGMAVLSGILPMTVYYFGLARTSASVAAFVELIYPVSAILINLIFLNASLAPLQLAASGVLLLSVIRLSF